MSEPGTRKDQDLRIRLTSEELDWIKVAAESRGNTVPGYIRWLVKKERDRLTNRK